MADDILELFSLRHSFYGINKDCLIGFDEIQEIIEGCLKLYPSPFNSQSARLALLGADAHQKFWDITEKKLLRSALPEKAAAIKEKIASFSNGCGTILYFTDTTVTKGLEEKFPLYADNFKNWAYQCNAILQFMIWTAFADKGIGASLQHYNPLVDDETADAFHIPPHWELTAQMPFGGIIDTPASHQADKIKDYLMIL